MKPTINRRQFTLEASTCVGGLMAAPWLLGADKTEGPEFDPAQKRLVWLGLNALARAHEMNYFKDGHRGASLVSAHLLIEENRLPQPARTRIEQLFDLNWAKSPLCQPFPEEDPDPSQIQRIGQALMEGQGTLREVGHDAIFAMLAIRGFRMLPTAATPRRIEGVCQLIRAIKPWRDDVKPDPDLSPPPFSDPAAATFVLREASAAIDKWIGFGQGYAGHMLTFGQALIELAEMGDVEWAEACRVAFCKYVTATRLGPAPGDRRIAEHKPSPLRPNQTEYWRQRGDKQLGLGHVFKYPYSYYDLWRQVEDPGLKREWEKKAFRVF